MFKEIKKLLASIIHLIFMLGMSFFVIRTFHMYHVNGYDISNVSLLSMIVFLLWLSRRN